MTTKQIEADLLKLLEENPQVLPFGTRVQEVQLLAGHKRKEARRRRPTADKASPNGDSLFIRLMPAEPGEAPKAAQSAAQPAEQAALGQASAEEELADLIRALDVAEKTPGHSFVALKWFRDAYLPRQDFAWAASPEGRNRVLREATSRGWVLVSKIPNPRNPGFDTSALRVENSSPEVQRILGREAKLGWGFPRIKLSGEPMSVTVSRMRDEVRY